MSRQPSDAKCGGVMADKCAFVGARGRCAERGFLEFHHVVPFAEGGETTSANLQLRRRPHNQYEAEEHFGPLFARERPAAYGLGSNRVASVLVLQWSAQ